ncbi:hypothetical protein WG915_02165 [Corynebacterium sp. H128]|uniref:hypothetical protein n=1 Tax=Corynebacterium sp. H128 TaxID=3133427 RepID=UPI0030B776C8
MNAALKTQKSTAILMGVCAVTAFALTACGDEKDVDAVAQSTAAASASSSSAAVAAATTTAPVNTAEPTAEVTPVETAEQGPNADGGLPQQPADSVQVEPLAGGRPASDEEVAELTAMLKRQEEQTTLHGYMNTFVDSMCSELINEKGGPEAFSLQGVPDAPLAQIPGYQQDATKVTGVNNMIVDGDSASAAVTTVTGAGESATNTMRFRSEQGQWKLCR